MDLSAFDRSAPTLCVHMKVISSLILKQCVLPGVETQHQVSWLLNALKTCIVFSLGVGQAKSNIPFTQHRADANGRHSVSIQFHNSKIIMREIKVEEAGKSTFITSFLQHPGNKR